MSNINISYLRNPDMEITLFREADKIKDGQLFIARKDSVEGRDKVILTPVENSYIYSCTECATLQIFGTEGYLKTCCHSPHFISMGLLI